MSLPLETPLRYAMLGINELASRGLRILARQARKLEIRIDGLGSAVFAPLDDIPFPLVDLSQPGDPLPLVLAGSQYREAVDYFARNASPTRSLLTVDAQALLYVLARNLRPEHVIEIGVFKAATTEAIARALHANGSGVVHAVDPYRSEYIAAVFKQWPPALAAHVSFHPRDSVAFFDEIRRSDIRPSLVLIDGNHDYEFAAFDIASAARRLTSGGFLLVDNIAQPGPFWAVRDFLAHNPGWIECGGSTANFDRTLAHDQNRTRIHNTDLIVLRAPREQYITDRPWTPGQQRRADSRVNGIRLALNGSRGEGTLHAQVVLRGFGAQLAEVSGTGSLRLTAAPDTITIPLASPLSLTGAFTHFTVEPWLMWEGQQPLRLTQPPQVV
jgi:predicted O-methyltransferase YrrM